MAPVAGGNAGLGYETSLAIAKAGGHVVLAVRNPEKGSECVSPTPYQFHKHV